MKFEKLIHHFMGFCLFIILIYPVSAVYLQPNTVIESNGLNSQITFTVLITSSGGGSTTIPQSVFNSSVSTTNKTIVLTDLSYSTSVWLIGNDNMTIENDGTDLAFDTGSGDASFSSNVEATGSFIANSLTGITGNYSLGTCWMSYSGGIMYSTNCTPIS